MILTLWSSSALAKCVLFAGALTHLPEKEQISDVLVGNDRIVSVGAGLPSTWNGESCEKMDGKGLQLTAGFIEANSHLGLVEVSLEDRTSDFDAEKSDPVRASLRVADAYNPASTLIPISRRGGVTSAITTPSGGLVSGQSGWVDLAGDTQRASVIRPSIAVRAEFSAFGSRAESLLRLRELLDDARRYSAKKAVWSDELLHPDGVSLGDLEALQPVLKREVPLVIAANRAADIEALLRLAEQQQIKLVIEGGAEAWMVADLLAISKTAVILDPYVYGPGGFDEVHGRAENAALLEKAGVPVILSTFSSHNARLLPQAAGNAVRGGMTHAGAIRAISSTPAEVFGVPDRGKIAVGSLANLVLWSGDPLELSTNVKGVWIGGQAMSLETRQTKLRDKYREIVK